MKKEFIVGILFLVLFASFTVAAENENLNLGSTSNVRDKTNEALSKQIKIPENLQLAARIVFGLKASTPVDTQTFVILIGLWVIVLLLVKNILEVFPMVGEGVKSWAVGILVTLLIAFSGGVRLAAGWILSISRFFGLLEKWGLARFIISLLVLVGIFYLISKVIKTLKKRVGVEGMAQDGRDAGFVSAAGKIMKESMDK